ncbi:MAG: hypothetical protein EA406_11795 [Rhodospirillales bacterium]|nr:MAG: hypothetical protein EA406_11795 [Rhodospirillales bacterium]
MTKKIAFGRKPGSPAAGAANPDEWVANRDVAAMKRLTIDVPADLHARIKSQCALRGVKMADAIRELLEQQFSGNT